MNTAAYVDKLITDRKAQIAAGGIPLSPACFEVAMACEGMAYVYSAWGAECTKSERQKRYNMTQVQNIISACQVLSGKKGTCDGCKWYPDRFRTRVWDCRGFVKWTIEQITGFALYGDTCATQWGHAANWCRKGQIGKDPIPEGVLVVLYIYKDDRWKHAGLYFNGATCECSSGVQYFEKMKANRWTHWAVAAVFRNELKEAEDVAEGKAIVTGKNVAIRKDRSTASKCLGRVKTGETVQLAEAPPEEWLRVEYKGKVGWMMREFLKEG